MLILKCQIHQVFAKSKYKSAARINTSQEKSDICNVKWNNLKCLLILCKCQLYQITMETRLGEW